MRLALLPILLGIAVCPASAAVTEWQEVAPEVRVRLVADTARPAPAKVYAALEIEMPEAYTTYWRIPGQAGIAPELDWSASTGISAARILFPLPVADQSTEYLDFIYRGPMALPIELDTSGDGAVLEASVFLGICSDVCMPISAAFSLPLGGGEEPREVADIVASAFSRVPAAWEFPDPSVASVVAVQDGLVVTPSYGGIGMDSLIVSTAIGEPLFGPSVVYGDGTAFVPLREGTGVMPELVDLAFDSDMGVFAVSMPVTKP